MGIVTEWAQTEQTVLTVTTIKILFFLLTLEIGEVYLKGYGHSIVTEVFCDLAVHKLNQNS